MSADQHPPDAVQYDMLTEFTKETGNFLSEYDSIVLHKELYRSLFLYTLGNLRDHVVKLLQKYSTLPKEDFEDKEIECCGISFSKYDNFREHYEQVHHKRILQSAVVCELKMSMTKITFFERSLRWFLAGGEISSCEMIFKLKRILRKINATLEF